MMGKYTKTFQGGDVAAVQAQQESVTIEEAVQRLTTQSRQFPQTNAAGRNKRQCGQYFMIGGGGLDKPKTESPRIHRSTDAPVRSSVPKLAVMTACGLVSHSEANVQTTKQTKTRKTKEKERNEIHPHYSK